MNIIIRMSSCCRLRMLSSNCTLIPIDLGMAPVLIVGCYRPGDYLPHDADEISGFKERLNDRLAPTNPTTEDTDWDIGDCLAQW
jgi:hypothetical protein